MSNISKRRREGSRIKIKTMGDHKEFLKRITKTLYYGHLPTLPCLSLPVTEISCEVWSTAAAGVAGAGGGRARSLRRLQAAGAARMVRGACVSPCALVLALLYLERLRRANPDYLLRAAPQDLFLVSLMVGNKFLQDDGEDEEVIGAEWAASGNLDTDTLNRLELQFLDAIEWNVYVNESSFEAGLRWVERRVALKQAAARGFFTYGDLAAACEAEPLARALAAACLALGAALATLLTSALVVSHAALPALRLLADLRDGAATPPTPLTPLTPLDYSPPSIPMPAILDRNATSATLMVSFGNESESRERIEWCSWAERVAVQRGGRRDGSCAEPPSPPSPPECAHGWLSLCKLSALPLLVTVSDR